MLQRQNAGLEQKFWDGLGNFWLEDQIKIWQQELFSEEDLDGNGEESAKNLICLSKDAHNYWNRGLFALQPTFLSPDKTTLEITFYWQPKLEGDADGNVNLFTQPQSSRDLDTPNGKIGLTTLSNPRRLKTGDKFTLTTDDPVNLPLPSFELLRLQFFLQRVCGMAGAAEALDLEGRSEDGWASDGAGLGLEDMEDWTWS